MKYADILPFVKEENLAFKEFFKHIEDTELPEDGFMWLFEHDIISFTCIEVAAIYEETDQLMTKISQNAADSFWLQGHYTALQMFGSDSYPKSHGEAIKDALQKLLTWREKDVKRQDKVDRVARMS